jgi:hypothetical protein
MGPGLFIMSCMDDAFKESIGRPSPMNSSCLSDITQHIGYPDSQDFVDIYHTKSLCEIKIARIF